MNLEEVKHHVKDYLVGQGFTVGLDSSGLTVSKNEKALHFNNDAIITGVSEGGTDNVILAVLLEYSPLSRAQYQQKIAIRDHLNDTLDKATEAGDDELYERTYDELYDLATGLRPYGLIFD